MDDNGYLFDLSPNFYYQFVTPDGKLDKEALLAHNYTEEHHFGPIEELLIQHGKLKAPEPSAAPAPAAEPVAAPASAKAPESKKAE
jgi:hypothetical protein